jgi:hypothetical protein
VWPLYRSSSRGGALFNFSIFQSSDGFCLHQVFAV